MLVLQAGQVVAVGAMAGAAAHLVVVAAQQCLMTGFNRCGMVGVAAMHGNVATAVAVGVYQNWRHRHRRHPPHLLLLRARQ